VPAAGGITVPLNTRLAPPEIAYILEDSAPTMLFIDGTFAPVLAQLAGRLGAVRDIVYLDDDALPAGMRAFEDLLDAPPFTEVIAQDDDVAASSIPAAPPARRKV